VAYVPRKRDGADEPFRAIKYRAQLRSGGPEPKKLCPVDPGRRAAQNFDPLVYLINPIKSRYGR
jgi:hypothetical protein